MNRDNNVTLSVFQRGNTEEMGFILKAFNSSDYSLFWSQKTRAYTSIDEVVHTLDSQVGTYEIYIGKVLNCSCSFFIVHSISSPNRRAELLAFVDPQMRGKIYTFSWWILLLQALKVRGINRVFAKVFKHNTMSRNSAVQAGFELCGILPEYVSYNGGLENVYVFSRRTSLSLNEKRWLQRLIKTD